MMKDCDLRDGWRCKKFDSCLSVRNSCEKNASDRSWFTEKFKVCEVDEVCRRASIFGSACFKITKEQLQALKEGKVLYDIDEYSTFIILGEDAK